ncbi:MAG: cytochrome d ubiquinol oxidase subunit II [Clostridia bacterium]
MPLELIGITVLWIFLYGYLIVASIDFGAGFFSYYGRLTNKEAVINPIIERYLSPVWEVTNVFLIFFAVGIVGFFPDVAYYYGTAFLVPGSIALILWAIRGSFYAFANYGARKNTIFMFIYGVSGLLLPAALSTFLTISEGGFVVEEGKQVVLQMDRLLTSPYSWMVVLLALVSVLFISASFLTYYANKAEDHDARNLLRKFTLFWSFPTLIASFFVFVTLSQHNMEHFLKMVDVSWMFLLSLVCFSVALYLFIYRKHYGVAFLFVMLQFAFAFFGYGASHLPYLLYPYITIYSGITSIEMGIALVIAFIAGLFLLIPSLILLMRLFLFNVRYIKG